MRLIPLCSTIGKTIEVVKTTIEIPSRKKPKTIKNKVSMMMSSVGESPIAEILSASILGMPVKPIARLKKAAPAMMKVIMQDVLVAPNRLSLNVVNERFPVIKDKTNAPNTPSAAASVAVAQPA